MKKLIILFVVLLAVFGFVGCSDDDDGGNGTMPTVTAPAAGNLKIACWLNTATVLPAANNAYIIGNAGSLDGFTNATLGGPMKGDAAAGAVNDFETNIMAKVSDTLYTIEMTAPSNTFSGAVDFKFINEEGTIADADGGDIGGSWENIGAQLTGINNNNIVIENNKIITWNAPGGVGTAQISADGSTLIVDLASLGGWAVDLGLTKAEITLTINWSAVPASHTKGGTWADLGDGDAVITGSGAWMHTDGTTSWNPTLGIPVTVTIPTATVELTIPAGVQRNFEFKMANVAGWDNGEELNNQSGTLTDDAAQTVNVTFSE